MVIYIIYIILTCTNGKNDEQINIVSENINSNNTSADWLGCRPGRLYIYNNLKKYFKYFYTLKTQPKFVYFSLVFPYNNDFSRCIFIASHIEIKNDNFIF